MRKQAGETAKAFLPAAANPAAMPTKFCSAMPTSTICCGSALPNGPSLPEPRESLVTTTTSADAAAILPHLPRDQYPAQALAAALYVASGIRAMERGAVSAGRDHDTGQNIFPKLELVRLTLPRRVYTQAHMDVVAESVENLFEARERVSGLRFVYEPEHLRFFQTRFEPVAEALFRDTAAVSRGATRSL